MLQVGWRRDGSGGGTGVEEDGVEKGEGMEEGWGGGTGECRVSGVSASQLQAQPALPG